MGRQGLRAAGSGSRVDHSNLGFSNHNGWQVQALTGWELLKDELARVPQLAPWVPVIDQLIGGT